MLRLIGKRLLLLIPTLFGLSVLLFVWVRSLPGGPATALLGDRATPEAVARVNAAYGFDKPLLEQYLTYMGRLLRGDFGTSTMTNRSVVEEFADRFPATLELSIFAIVFAVVIGIPLGYWAARHVGRWQDDVAVVLSLVGVVVPVFFLAFILKWVFAVKLGWLPTDGRQDPRIDATHYTNFYVWDGIITAEWDAALNALTHLVLPGIALGTIPLAIIARITRASVLDVQDADFVRTARAKGLAPRLIRDRFIMRNALLPVSTTLGLQLGLLISGAVLTESTFSWPGLGLELIDYITARDYAAVQGIVTFFAVVVVVVSLAVDIVNAIVDPRVRY